ncbi:MAG TPA: hypothetical protein VI750_14550 [Pyrinomonadaceae bacterium]|nr:hypothetical protein [Pyrinomonadaceae bacterium]
MKLVPKRWLWISLAVFVCVMGLGYLGYRELDRQWNEMLLTKVTWTSPATVVRKTDGRVYYQIDNFDRLPEPRRSRATEAESIRLRQSGPRSRGPIEWFDRVEPGSKICVRYQCFSDGQLEVVGVNIKDC